MITFVYNLLEQVTRDEAPLTEPNTEKTVIHTSVLVDHRAYVK